MGAVLEQDIRVKASSGFRLDTAQLPEAGSAYDDYLEIRRVTWTESDEFTGTVYDIHLSYQVFKGVRSPERLEVDGLPLRFVAGDEVLQVEAPAWSITVRPIIDSGLADEAVSLAAEMPAPARQFHHGHSMLIAWLLAALAIGLYGAWRLNAPPFRRRSRPFARARKALRKLRRSRSAAEKAQRAYRLVHQAFDQAAGYTVFAGELDEFLEARPLYGPLRGKIETFFALSRQFFFASENRIEPGYGMERGGDTAVLQWLETLCAELDQTEAAA
ncbi:hypothetical protein [Methylococcus sp. EFPC2]|uniref:hypothetical protein n=1 Tax=Methylococcus sp. EFPC2 TaxID=2812648 RepID=UPI00196838C8|nr:hypothetical protein [Methylococcus sp. EFPC2]QSA98436.1 hypothetical protein JWZ97_06410 [Methylococcus sp. EFPC2]